MSPENKRVKLSPAAADRLMEQMGFDLRQVTWGYREIFRQVIVELEQTGLLGLDSGEVTGAFFEVLRRSDQAGLDMVVKAFLEALRGRHRWIMRLPRLFERWGKMGMRLADRRCFLGARFFEYAGQGKLGSTPKEIEFVLDLITLLLQEEPELIAPLMDGYGPLRRRLDPPAVREFLRTALDIHARNPASAAKFLACELESSHTYIERFSRQAGLADSRDALERLARALCGHEMTVESLGELDSDDLHERTCPLVSCRHAVYVPERIAEFPSRAVNEATYKTMVSMAAASVLANGFATVHGLRGAETCRDLFPPDGKQREVLCGMFCLVELCRIAQFCRDRFPGIRGELQRLVEMELAGTPTADLTGNVTALLLGAPARDPSPAARELADALRDIAQKSTHFETTRDLLTDLCPRLTCAAQLLARELLPRPLCFYPDPLFPLSISVPGEDQLMADLHDARPAPPEEEPEGPQEPGAEEPTEEAEDHAGSGDESSEQGRDAREGLTVGYFYDEWNVHCADYLHKWCCVHESRPRQATGEVDLSDSVMGYAERVRKVFERLKPEQMRVEKRLLDGDSIHLDHFVEYISQGQRKQNSEMRFYNKPLTRKRDLAVAVLLDLSGSTAEQCETGPQGAESVSLGIPELERAGDGKTVLEVEKEAAFVLATGLEELQDSFALFGFTGNGRENCLFYVFSDFDEKWSRDNAGSLFAAPPGSATRIGAALRHAGWRLRHRGAKTKLLLLITDGKPCDQGYETESHYAQHDIRKACQENQQEQIHTFCVSTSENSPADMELMFPNGRYLILEDISRLSSVLSRLYVRLTK